MSKKKKKGAKVSGDPRKRQAEKQHEDAKKLARLQPFNKHHSGNFDGSGIDPHNDPLSYDDLDKSDELAEQFLEAFPEWKKIDSWNVQSQIIRAFDAFIMWQEEAESSNFDLNQCFEVNKVTDVAADVRSFLVSRGLYIESGENPTL